MRSDLKRMLATSALLYLLFGTGITASAAETRLQKPLPEGGTAVLTFAEAPLKTMTETPFSIVLTSKTGKKISNAKLNISLDMPAMQMPPNNPYAGWQDDAYRGVAVFTMAGAWQVFVNIQRPGYDQRQIIFDIDQVEMK